MDKKQVWNVYFEKNLNKKHHIRLEKILRNHTLPSKIAIDAGCGTGGDSEFLLRNDFVVHAFDCFERSVEICHTRLAQFNKLNLEQNTFENYDYPVCSLFYAGSSLFFANPQKFSETWSKIQNCIIQEGIFVGDFLGVEDSWASNYHSDISAFTKEEVEKLFGNFEVLKIFERNEKGKSSLNINKNWHVFSVIAKKKGNTYETI